MNEAIMRACGFSPSVDAVKAGRCPFCGEQVNDGDFRDELSRREHRISGLCQKCQDQTFRKAE